MHRTSTRRLATSALLGAGLLALASPAFAHPTFNPNQLPAGQTVDVDFVIPHGCTAAGGMPADGETTSPTHQVAVDIPAELAGFTGEGIDGWTASAVGSTFVWTADDGVGSTEPLVFPATVTIAEGIEDGTTIYLSAQECADNSIVWSAHDHDEGSPAAILVVGSEVGTASDEDHDDHGEDPDHMATDHESEHVDGMATDHESEHVDGMATDHATEDMGEDHAMDDAAATHDGDNGLGMLALVMAFVVVGSIIGILKMGGSTAD